MKCLSLWQPWATLVARGAKRIETRSWSTAYRGPLLIHAARVYKPLSKEAAAYAKKLGIAVDKHSHRYGEIIAICDLVECDEILGLPSKQEIAFGNYAHGRYAWKLENVRQLAFPIPCRGHQRLFNVVFEPMESINAKN